jgi:osmotically-inducible protein OsmY
MKKKLPSLLLSAAAAALLAASLPACAPLVIGGAAVGAMVAFDRRTSGTQIEDETIELRGASAVRQALGDKAHVNVASYNRQVLLTGEVPTEQAKQTAEQTISRVENVKGVVNELAVMGNSTMTQRSSDTLVTAKVKASLVDAKDLYVGAFRVVTERGTTYLMGRVTQREADRATQMTRTISGVQRVVRVFEVISDEDLRRMAPSQARAGAAPAAVPLAPAAASATAPATAPGTAPVVAAPVTAPVAVPSAIPASAAR